jgi:predicted HTH transcriptional regulator
MTLRLSTEAELKAALEAGLLEESHALDLKRELGPSGTSTNKALAQDLASFAIDGGQLLIGVAEDPLELHPVPLDGLAERVESVSLSRIDQPLQVSAIRILSVDDPSCGYLLVTVPASPLAPHMVDHVYYGRSDRRNYRLSDLEVARLIRRRRDWQLDVEGRLKAFMAKDPTGPGSRTHRGGRYPHLLRARHGQA